MPDPDGRRSRSTVSCALCRKRKVRCDRQTPCSNCVRSRNENCVYENDRPRNHVVDSGLRAPTLITNSASRSSSRPTIPPYGVDSRTVSSSAPTTPPSTSGPDEANLEQMKLRIKHLEEQLATVVLKPDRSPVPIANSQIQTTSSRFGGTFHVHCGNDPSNQSHGIARSVSHKNRLFGQSHWAVNGVLQVRESFDLIEAHLGTETPIAWTGIEQCKSLARVIKTQRTPLTLWPFPTSPDLPSKDVADTLVDCYLRTSESIYRVLHIPTFRRDYDALWVSDSTPDANFLAQLQLVLAIGATTYDEHFSLRSSALRWVSTAQAWQSQPKFKARLDLGSIQTHILFLIAQEKVAFNGDSTWILAGSLIRRAVYIGLHKDPTYLPHKTALNIEMRRRLWNTVMELALQSSLTSGGPPFISMGDFDVAAPNNFDDDQLMADDPVPQPEDHFTQVSVAIMLRNTFPQRLAIVKFLNDLGSSGTYQETLRLDTELRGAYNLLSRTFQSYNNAASNATPSRFEMRVVNFMMHRYLSSLHVPYCSAALQETSYYFSRKVVVESSLKIWHLAFSSSASSTVNDSSIHNNQLNNNNNHALPDYDELARLITCSAGFYPTVAIQAAFLIAMELRMQINEEEGMFSGITLRPDLVAVLEESKAWCLQTIEAGETNVKGLLLMSTLSAHLEGLSRGMEKSEIARLLVKTVHDVKDKCVPILERMATVVQNDKTAQMPHQQQQGFSVEGTDMMEDWGFLSSDAPLDMTNNDPMNWVFNDNGDGVLGSSFW
ncbi:hypothetical protein PG989_001746 [Apiospora arundinis]